MTTQKHLFISVLQNCVHQCLFHHLDGLFSTLKCKMLNVEHVLCMQSLYYLTENVLYCYFQHNQGMILVIQPCHLLNPLALILKAQSLLNIQHLPTVKQTQTPPAWTAAGDASPCSFGATLTRTCSRWRSAPCAATPSSPTEAAQQNEHQQLQSKKARLPGEAADYCECYCLSHNVYQREGKKCNEILDKFRVRIQLTQILFPLVIYYSPLHQGNKINLHLKNKKKKQINPF